MAMTSASARYDRMVREPASQGASEPGSQRSSDPASQGAREPASQAFAVARWRAGPSAATNTRESDIRAARGKRWRKLALPS